MRDNDVSKKLDMDRADHERALTTDYQDYEQMKDEELEHLVNLNIDTQSKHSSGRKDTLQSKLQAQYQSNPLGVAASVKPQVKESTLASKNMRELESNQEYFVAEINGKSLTLRFLSNGAGKAGMTGKL